MAAWRPCSMAEGEQPRETVTILLPSAHPGTPGNEGGSMTTTEVNGSGTKEQPWVLRTPSGQAEFQAFRDETLEPPALVVQVGKTELRYHLRCIADLHAMLRAHGDWMPLGSADEQKPAAEGTVEAWGRS